MIRDLEIEEICTAECRVIYLSCRDDCVDQSCDAQCSSEYTLCLNNCPCSINCPDGCIGCDYYLCENSTVRIFDKSLSKIIFPFLLIRKKDIDCNIDNNEWFSCACPGYRRYFRLPSHFVYFRPWRIQGEQMHRNAAKRSRRSLLHGLRSRSSSKWRRHGLRGEIRCQKDRSSGQMQLSRASTAPTEGLSIWNWFTCCF